MKILSRLALPVVFMAFLSSCKTQQAFNYLQDLKDTSGKVQVKYPEPLIQEGDQLFIAIISEAADDGKVDLYYNPNVSSGSNPAIQGYLVDMDGFILYPRLGKIKAEGLTKSQLADDIKKKVTGPLTNPTVIVKLMNFKITMLGEVARPGAITLPSEKVSILEAIGLAGDVTIYGKKNEIVVLREVDDIVEHGVIDLSSKEIFQSPYYYLRQNDVVLVNPTKNKARLNDQVFNQRLGVAFGIINMIALLYNIFR